MYQLRIMGKTEIAHLCATKILKRCGFDFQKNAAIFFH